MVNSYISYPYIIWPLWWNENQNHHYDSFSGEHEYSEHFLSTFTAFFIYFISPVKGVICEIVNCSVSFPTRQILTILTPFAHDLPTHNIGI